MKRVQTIFLSLAFAVSANAEINVADSIIESQEQTVSLGYIEVNKADINSAVVTLTADELNDITTNDFNSLLQGKVAGLQVINPSGQPGSSAEMIIRGLNSISSGSEPIYVVDGVIGGTFHPNDVESVSILKDAGAAGIYGAANGVIVITTKQGKFNQKPHVTLRARAGGSQPLFGNYRMMDSKELYAYHQQMYNDKGITGSSFTDLRPASLLDQDYNWQNEFFGTSLVQNYYASVSGGGKKVAYYISLDYFGQEGTLKTTDMQKFAGHAALKINACKWLDMNVKIDFASSKTNQPYSWMMLNDAFYKLPWDCPYEYNSDGTLSDRYIRIENGTRPDNGEKWWSQETWNALHGSQYNYDKSKNNSSALSLQLNFHITDWLHFTSTNNCGITTSKSEFFIDPRTYDIAHKDGYRSVGFQRGWNFVTTNILRAAYSWGDHSVSGLIGGEYNQWESKSRNEDYNIALDGTNVIIPSYSLWGDDWFRIPGARWGVFAQAGYNYAKRYFITAAYRCEVSSHFAPKGRNSHFPSVAAAWLISNEAFMQGQNIVSLLKLRANYGITGNESASAYQFGYSYDPSMGAVYPSRISSNLAWEYTNTFTVGIDLAFINRIDMSIDLYHSDNNGLTVSRAGAPSTGFYSRTENVGKMRNRGIEYRLNAQAIKTNDLRWDIGFNIAFNQNTVTEMPDGDHLLLSKNSVCQEIKEGQALGTWYMREWAGVDSENGDPLWYVVDAEGNKTTTNNYNEATETAVGKATPLFFGGLNTQVSWKGLALSINTDFTYGNKIYNYTRHATDADGAYLGYNQLSMENNRLGWSRWTQPGDIATHPKAVLGGNQNANQISSRYLEDGSFFRLKNITLSYDFCATLIPKKYMSKLRVYVSADNVVTATKFSGMNPEVSLTNNDLPGFYTESYPLSRNIVGGIEIEF